MNLKKLFYPDSLAVVGASDKEGKLGYNVLRNLVEHGYEGDIYPVNPKYGEVQGIQSYESVGELDDNIDAAVSIVPSKATPQIVENCFEKGIDFVSVQSAGFGEKGGEGKKVEKELERLVKDYDGHILGPNCTGVINVNTGLVQSIGRVGKLEPGNVGLIAQAGVYAAGILWGLRKIMDFSMIATIGNKLDIDETDVLKFMGEEETVEVIAMYLEDIERGGDFINEARDIAQDKPIIVLKGGRTGEGKKTAATHTASIGGPREVYETIFRESGIIQASDNEHMFDLARAFSKQPLPSSSKMMIITYSGSQGITGTDTLNEHGLELAKLEGKTREEIAEIVPDVIEGVNPADLTFDQSPEQVREIIETACEDEEVDGFIANLQPEILEDYADEFRKMDSGGKPVYISVTGREFAMKDVEMMENVGYPVFATPERAAQVAAESYKHEHREIEDSSPRRFEVESSRVKEIIENSLEESNGSIGGAKAFKVFEAYGIPTIEHYIAQSSEEASAIFERIDGPVAMKIESEEALHKTEIGGVELDVREDASSSFNEIMERVEDKSELAEDQLKGVCIQPMLRKGHETLIGANYEETIDGHIIKFGLGGEYTEIFEDISMRTAPLNPEKAEALIEETNYVRKLLKGPRGEEACDESKIVESLHRLSKLVEDFPEVVEIEANPFLVWSDGAAVLDARLKVREK